MNPKKQTMKLGDLCQITVGRTPRRKDLDNFGGSYVWITISDMTEKYVKDSKEKLTEKGAKNGRLIPKGTLLLSYKLSLGKVAITEIPLYTNEAIAALIPKQELNMEYLYYYLKQLDLSKYGRKAVKGLCLNKEILSQIKIQFPPIKEQNQIVFILDSAEKLKLLREESDKLVNNYLNGLFLRIFGDPFRNEKGWNVQSLENICNKKRPIIYGIVQPGNNYKSGIPVVRSLDLVDDFLIEENLKVIDPEIEAKHPKSRLKGGELLVSVRGTIGPIALVRKPLDRLINITRGVAIIDPIEEVKVQYLFGLFILPSFRRYLNNFARGIALRQLNLNILRSLKIPIPTLELQREYSKYFDEIRNMKSDQALTGKRIQELMGRLSQQFLVG